MCEELGKSTSDLLSKLLNKKPHVSNNDSSYSECFPTS